MDIALCPQHWISIAHVLPGFQEAAARQFDEGFEHEVHQRNVGKIVLRGLLGVEFISRRGVREVYGDGLENRCSRKGTVGSNPTPSATNHAQ